MPSSKMDILYSVLLSLLFVVVSCSLCFAFFKSKPSVDGNPPPGQRGWPLIGESIEFLTGGWKGHPEKFIFNRMTKFSRHVFRTSLMLEDVAVFCGPEGNKFLFSNENKLVQVWWPASVQKLSPSYDQSMKNINILRKYFKPENLHQYVPSMDMVVQKHFETEWEGKDKIVTHNVTRFYTFLAACKIFISIDGPEKVNYLLDLFETFYQALFSIPIDLPGTPVRRALKAGTFIRKELAEIIKQRKNDLSNGKVSPTQDILSLILCDDDGKIMDEYEVSDMIITLLVGGHENTSSTCEFIVKYLAQYPEIYKGVYKEQIEIARSKASTELLNKRDISKMKYSWNVACEVLRLISPVPGTFREAIDNFEYKGYTIPKGWKLYWSANATHKNPNCFPEPERFDPSRFDKGLAPYSFVPFGGGPHLCPGQEYARIQILVFMHHLVRKFKWREVIPNEQIVFGPTPKLAKGLPILIYPNKA